MSAEIILIITLSVILLISPFLSNLLKLPISMIEIILGSLAAESRLLYKNHLFDLLAEFGFLYLMLLAGMEVNLKELIKLDKDIFKKGLFFFMILYILSLVSVGIFHFTKIFIAILPLISIGLILSIQQEIGKKDFLTLALKIGVIGELLSILVLTILNGYFEFGLSKELFLNISFLFGFLIILGMGFVIVRTIFWWFPKIKYSLMPGVDKYYQDVRIAMSLFFIMIAVMIILHLDVVLGAFVVGVFLTTFFDHNHHLEDKLAPFGFGFLITIFFVHVGSSINIYDVNWEMIKDSLMLTSLMIMLRIVSALVFVNVIGVKNSILFGLSLSMPLTLLIATATLAYYNHTINSYWYTVLVFASVLEVVVVMLGVKFINKLQFQKKG